ncbi:hypothetical protein MTQ00_12320 [Chryseobacterium sp. B21-037]|uniref:hypothetical protein n=1 Tax=Chryseobacterium sp. B21-037 TaxID=2926038 RepID=UPI0023583CBE|nr:hypothetical protein [Chryseobacterium sp. B21-037]MDC8105329.1 hypothetical protein [Chryseobacterium sp. B21-037]
MKRKTLRIQKILTDNLDKTYGFDISHYQNKEDIKWDSLSIGKQNHSVGICGYEGYHGK